MQTKKEQKKQLLTLQAYELLVEKGVEGFSLNNYLESVSMSKGNFYHYFKNKDELFCESIKLGYENILAQKAALKNDANFEEKLESLFYIYLHTNPQIDQYIKLINQMYYLFTNEKNIYLYNYMQEVYAYTFYVLEQIIQEEIEKKHLKKEITTMIKPIVATADGMFTHAFLLKDYNLQAELKNYFHFIAKHYGQ